MVDIQKWIVTKLAKTELKKYKKFKTAHTSSSQIGMGDYYGTGIRNPMGRVRDTMEGNYVAPRKLKKAPKALA